MTLLLAPESTHLADYLAPSAVIDWQHPTILPLAKSLTQSISSVPEQIRVVYEWVRDFISHTCDIGGDQVTCTASEVLHEGHGFCFAKAHLLAALLRSCGIPTGFCGVFHKAGNSSGAEVRSQKPGVSKGLDSGF